jgi:hypothetical protein
MTSPRKLPDVIVLHEYVVRLRREQFAEDFVVARDPETAEAMAVADLEADELTWFDGDVEVENVEEAP